MIASQAASAAIDYAAANPRDAVRSVARMGGRLAGIGGFGLDAIEQRGIPIWFWVVLGGVAGFAGGVYVTSRHPDRIPRWMPGRGG